MGPNCPKKKRASRDRCSRGQARPSCSRGQPARTHQGDRLCERAERREERGARERLGGSLFFSPCTCGVQIGGGLTCGCGGGRAPVRCCGRLHPGADDGKPSWELLERDPRAGTRAQWSAEPSEGSARVPVARSGARAGPAGSVPQRPPLAPRALIASGGGGTGGGTVSPGLGLLRAAPGDAPVPRRHRPRHAPAGEPQ